MLGCAKLMNQSRYQAYLGHKHVVKSLQKPSLPDRYVLTINPYGAQITPCGFRSLVCHSSRARRGLITTFSEQSRRRLMRRLSYLYHPKITFLTLTYPGYPSAQKVKRDIEVFGKRLLRKFPRIMIIWRIERQRRGSWHIHMLVYGMPFLHWRIIATMWVEVAGLSSEHIQTTTHIRLLRGNGRQYMYYVSKYISKLIEDDGNDDSDRLTGRHWGIIGRANEPLYWYSYTLIVPAASFYALRRVIRRLRGKSLFITFRQYLWGCSTIIMRYFSVSPDSYYRERLPAS